MSSERAIRAALGQALTNVSNYPDAVRFRLLGLDLSDVISEATEAVMATGLIGPGKDVDAYPDVQSVHIITKTEKDIYSASGAMMSVEDDGKTLKVFLSDGEA